MLTLLSFKLVNGLAALTHRSISTFVHPASLAAGSGRVFACVLLSMVRTFVPCGPGSKLTNEPAGRSMTAAAGDARPGVSPAGVGAAGVPEATVGGWGVTPTCGR